MQQNRDQNLKRRENDSLRRTQLSAKNVIKREKENKKLKDIYLKNKILPGPISKIEEI